MKEINNEFSTMNVCNGPMKAIRIVSLVFNLGIIIVGSACSIDSPYRYGVISLKVNDKQQVYFKSESRGVSFESLALSANGDPCIKADPKVDYIIHSSALPKVYYKIEGDNLILYSVATITPPESKKFPVKVIHQEMHPLEYVELEKSYEKLGVRYLEIKLDENLKCP